MKLFEFCTHSAAPALAADRSGAAVLRTAEPMAMAAAKAASAVTVADQAFTARAPRIRFAPAASVIGSGYRVRLR